MTKIENTTSFSKFGNSILSSKLEMLSETYMQFFYLRWRHEIQQKIVRCGCRSWLACGRILEGVCDSLSQISVFLLRIMRSLKRRDVVGIVRTNGTNRTNRTNLIVTVHVRSHAGTGGATVWVVVVVVSCRAVILLLSSASRCRSWIVRSQSQPKYLREAKK